MCVSVTLVFLSHSSIHAQADQQCFRETGHCISGRILEFWQQNGGASTFGHPRGPQQQEYVDGQLLKVQWFDKSRLELHPENVPPRDVVVGRIGIDRLTMQGRDWEMFPKGQPQSGCEFEQFDTGQGICPPFLDFWQSHGVELDGVEGTTPAESLALFGAPISAPQTETESNTGDTYTVQWFERARLEYRRGSSPSGIVVANLGAELFPLLPATHIPPEPDLGQSSFNPTTGHLEGPRVSNPDDFRLSSYTSGPSIEINPLPEPGPEGEAILKVTNGTKGVIHITLEGPTSGTWPIEENQVLPLNLEPGNYQITSVTRCGSTTQSFNIQSRDVKDLNLQCEEAIIRILNSTESFIRISLVGYTTLEWSGAHNSNFRESVVPGDYHLTFFTQCGSSKKDFTLGAGEEESTTLLCQEDRLATGVEATIEETGTSTVRILNQTGFPLRFILSGTSTINKLLAPEQQVDEVVDPGNYEIRFSGRCGSVVDRLSIGENQIQEFIPTCSGENISVASDQKTSAIRVINSNDVEIQVSLSGSSEGNWIVASGQTLEIPLFTGDYQATFTTACGQDLQAFSVENNQVQEFSPECQAPRIVIQNDGNEGIRFNLSGPSNLSASIAAGQTYEQIVQPGSYQVSASTSCGTVTESFSVQAGEVYRLSIGSCQPGTITIENQTGGALQIRLSGALSDSQRVGHGATFRRTLPPGTYRITVVAICGSETMEITLEDGGEYGNVYYCN